MDNYEINILRRGGNWKKVKPDDLVIDEINNEFKGDEHLIDQNSQDTFLSNINKVNSIIVKLELLEIEKNKLKEELKSFEVNFIEKKKKTEDKINEISKEKEMIDKTLNILKNLKTL